MASIHQPNTDILMLFDQLYVISREGQCVYNGHPLALKQHLNECQVPLLDYQVPIEQLIKVASSNDIDLVNKLVDKSTGNRITQHNLMIDEGDLLKSGFTNYKSFNLTDLMILLRRTFTNELIGGWKVQIGFLLSIFLSVFMVICLFPNDIGSDPCCPLEVIDLRNISLINRRILDTLM